MLSLKSIIGNPEYIKKKIALKGADTRLIDEIVELSEKRSEYMTSLQNLNSIRNKKSKEIGVLKSKNESTDNIFEEIKNLKNEISEVKEKEVNTNKEINILMALVPNLPSENTPEGKDENENVVIAEHDKIGRGLITGVKPHFEIGEELDLIDLERATKLSGSRFWSYKGMGARMVRALQNFMLDKHVENGYIEWNTPVIVNSDMLFGTGQLPKFGDDLFKLEGLDQYLIPTAEVTLTNLHNNEILNLEKPVAYTAFSNCFRSEAGSGGRDMRGLIRGHQFNKVELVKIVKEEDLALEYKKTIEDAKSILIDLEIPFREVQLCSGDVSFTSEETVDLEVWLPSEKKYREISSISSFGDFQGRRARIRYKDVDGANKSAFTINGSGIAIDRCMAAILENYQDEDGNLTIPNKLVPYMNNIKRITNGK